MVKSTILSSRANRTNQAVSYAAAALRRSTRRYAKGDLQVSLTEIYNCRTQPCIFLHALNRILDTRALLENTPTSASIVGAVVDQRQHNVPRVPNAAKRLHLAAFQEASSRSGQFLV